MISAASIHSFAERKTRNLLNMRTAWFKKEEPAESATTTSSPDMPRPAEVASAHGKPKALSRPRIRELLTIAVIRLMERMIAELFPCASDGEAGDSLGSAGSSTASGPLPNFEEFLKHICRRTRTPLTCMCLALLYLTRLRANHPRSRGSPGSSYRLALSSLCVATKYLYDDAYHTCSWVQVSMGLFSQREVNQMEMEFMYFLHYQLGVTPTEWNQWIATLEAKLVSRWQEKGKAEVIYGFGLFLSHECCEPGAQDAVRDIAWGEGGKNLLSLLDNAIQWSGKMGAGKSSPSADSAVSDTTCLPTPDPNCWFRIRSPVLPGAQSTALSTSAITDSNPITPTTAHIPDAPAVNDDKTSAYRSLARNSASSPSSCQYSALDVQPGGSCQHGSATFGGAHADLGVASTVRCSYPAHQSKSDCQGNDVRLQQPQLPRHTPRQQGHPPGQRLSQLAPEASITVSLERPATAVAPASSSCAYGNISNAVAHPTYAFGSSVSSSPSYRDEFSSGPSSYSQVPLTASSSVYGARQSNHLPPLGSLPSSSSISLSYTAESQDGLLPSRIPAQRPTAPPAVQGALSASGPPAAAAATAHGPTDQSIHFHTAPRSATNSAYSSRGACSTISFDRKSSHRSSALSKLTGGGSVPSRANPSGAAPACSSTSTATIASRYYRSNTHASGYGAGSNSNSTARAVSASAHRGTCTATTPSIYSISPAADPRSSRYCGGGTASAADTPGAASMKSFGSVSAANNSRQSWRQSHRNSAASFAQKLRSFAAFNWSSGGASSSLSNMSPPRKAPLSYSSEEDVTCGLYSKDAASVCGASNAYSRYADPKRNSCGHHISQTLFSRRHAEAQARAGSLSSVRVALETMASPPYDFEHDVAKYVSMKS